MSTERRESTTTHLVVDIGDVHDEVDIVAKVLGHYPAQNVHAHVVPVCECTKKSVAIDVHAKSGNAPGMAHMRRVVDSRPAVVPGLSLNSGHTKDRERESCTI